MVREWSIERDNRLIKELYPNTAKKVLPYVEAACDRMEYDGSRMYDEFPDKFMMEMVNQGIYEDVCGQLEEQEPGNEKSLDKKPEEMFADDEIFATSFRPGKEHKKEDSYLKELIDVLMYHEMFSRRCKHNQYKCCRR